MSDAKEAWHARELDAWSVLDVACPYPPCGAPVGVWCRDSLGQGVRRAHKKRITLACRTSP